MRRLKESIQNKERFGPKRKYRFEQKYIVSAAQCALLKGRISQLLFLDEHAKRGGYEIRSVYFDDVDNTCFAKNEAGVDERAKYRIRIYDASDAHIRLEKKIKQGGRTRKLSAPLTREQCETFLRGDNLSLRQEDADSYPELLRQFCALTAMRRMQPKVIVCYDRIPYVCRQGNVRVTLDLHIASSRAFDRFFDKELPKRPIMPKGQELLEVKYDEFLPGYIKDSLEIGSLRQTTFSKYYLCRKAAL
ncbi:MAG: polyphosphate polymerase domain-containing protein [Lachnospiraceae bacterium]|nr:polyphosphate polymerase domain-containing protein [Lachnospiraceae bacterium]